MSPEKRPSSKVLASTAGGGLGSAVAGFLIWAIDAQFFNGEQPPTVPGEISILILASVGAAGTFLAGYFKRSTHRDVDLIPRQDGDHRGPYLGD